MYHCFLLNILDDKLNGELLDLIVFFISSLNKEFNDLEFQVSVRAATECKKIFKIFTNI
jgi:hypothetical protein